PSDLSLLRNRPIFPFPAFILLPVVGVVGFDKPDLTGVLFVFLKQDHCAHAPGLAMTCSAVG
ncbi:MAG: hypothetical protein KGY46_10570, partial [Anaerolineales bacterium]|nr:hypothetical protein [Anaerolineales bacterium]